jgi:hypothetical protein
MAGEGSILLITGALGDRRGHISSAGGSGGKCRMMNAECRMRAGGGDRRGQKDALFVKSAYLRPVIVLTADGNWS